MNQHIEVPENRNYLNKKQEFTAHAFVVSISSELNENRRDRSKMLSLKTYTIPLELNFATNHNKLFRHHYVNASKREMSHTKDEKLP